MPPRPITSVPGAKVRVIPLKSDDFNWTCSMDPQNEQECINLASYNYLGFAENSGIATESVIKTTSRNGLTPCSPRQGMNCIKIGFPGKMILSKRKGIWEVLFS